MTEQYCDIAISFCHNIVCLTIMQQILLEGSNFKDVHNVKVVFIYYIYLNYFLFIIYIRVGPFLKHFLHIYITYFEDLILLILWYVSFCI